MSTFDQMDIEEYEPEEGVHPASSHGMLVVAYPGWKKAVFFIFAITLLPLLLALIGEGLFLQLLGVVVLVIGGWYLMGCIATRNITFFPDKVVRNGLFGQTILPVDSLVMVFDEQRVLFFHGTESNIRESIVVRRVMATMEEISQVIAYARSTYGISYQTGGAASKGKGINKLILREYEEAAASYKTVGTLLVVVGLVGVFTAAVTDDFSGLDPGWPPLLVRLACIALAVAGYFVLGKMVLQTSGEGGARSPLEVRLKDARMRAGNPALGTIAVSTLGLLLFFLFGNMLDLYFFLIVSILYFFDFYPRLSTWEKYLEGPAESETDPAVVAPRRSLQVSLVLMGALAVASQGETRHYLYANRQDCLNDWGDSKDCQEAPYGSSHYGSRYYYGPRYGSGGGRITRSVGIGTVSRGGFGSLGGFHASFGG